MSAKLTRAELDAAECWLIGVRAIPSQQPDRIAFIRKLHAHVRAQDEKLREIEKILNNDVPDVQRAWAIARAARMEE